MTNEQLYLAEVVTDYISQNDYLSCRDMRTLAHSGIIMSVQTVL